MGTGEEYASECTDIAQRAGLDHAVIREVSSADGAEILPSNGKTSAMVKSVGRNWLWMATNRAHTVRGQACCPEARAIDQLQGPRRHAGGLRGMLAHHLEATQLLVSSSAMALLL